jgi:hypothetical protein
MEPQANGGAPGALPRPTVVPAIGNWQSGTPARTEQDALDRKVVLWRAGEPVILRTLTIEESDTWLEQLTERTIRLDIPDDSESGVAVLAALIRSSTNAAVGLVAAYDLDGVLGGVDGIRSTMSKAELAHALEVMVSAETPFGDGARSVAKVFGAPMTALGAGSDLALRAMQEYLLAQSTSGPSEGSATATTESDASGAGSSSSSAGRTATTRPRRKRGTT